MLTPKLINTPKCAEIPALLKSINCKLDELASDLYNNTIYELNKNIPTDIISILLNYKRILSLKLINPDYCKKFKLDKIASRVKLLTLNCKCKCVYEERPTDTVITYRHIVNIVDCDTCNNITTAVDFYNIYELYVGQYYYTNLGKIFVQSVLPPAPGIPTDDINPFSGSYVCEDIICA